MKAHSRLYALLVALAACAFAIASTQASSAQQSSPISAVSDVARFLHVPSPYVSAAGPRAVANLMGALSREREQKTKADFLPSRLSLTDPNALVDGKTAAGFNPIAVTSTVQTQDYTLAAEPSAGYSATTNTAGVTTITAPSNTPTNVDPVWSTDEQTIYFASDRSSAATGNAAADSTTDGSEPSSAGLFHLYSIASDGSSTSAVQLIASTANERWPSIVGTSKIVYCETLPGSPVYGLYLASFNSGGTAIDTADASQLVVADNTGVALDCEHPSYSGGIVVFAARTVSSAGVYGHYHLYTFDIASGQLTQLTFGSSDDENPSFSTGNGLIAFDSNSTGFTNGVSNGVAAVRSIFVSTASATSIVQFSLPSSTTSSIDPAWTTAAISNVFVSNAGDTYLFFSSNRGGTGHYGIYDFDAQPNGGAFTAESTGSQATTVLTSDPTATATTGASDNFEPAPPQFRFYTSVLYVTPRTLINDDPDNPTTSTENPIGNSMDAPAGSVDNEPTQDPTNPLGVFTPVASGPSETFPTGGFEIFSSHLADIDPPTLLRYSANEILHTQNSSGTQTRYVPAGTAVTFLARLSDRQSGVGTVWLQFKNPNSKYQDSAGLEHKVFTRDPNFYNPATEQHPHDAVNEATTIDAIEDSIVGSEQNGLGIDNASVIGGYDSTNGGNNPIYLGHIVTSGDGQTTTPQGTTGTYPATGYSGQAELAATTEKYVTQITLNNIQNLTYTDAAGNTSSEVSGPNHLAGDVLQLFDSTGAPTEKVQIVSAAYVLGTAGASTSTTSCIVTPLTSIYATSTATPPGSTASAYAEPGYAEIVAISRFDTLGQEVDCQAIDANLAAPTGASTTEYSTPLYTPGYDDAAPHSGDDERDITNGTPNGDGVWLKMTPVPEGNPLNDHNGGVLYEATWTTPTAQSDWYVDVIAFDNAAPDAQNWRIYDNIWGFTTQPFSAGHGVLIVNDYMLPQKFFSGRFGTIASVNSGNIVGASANVPQNFFGGEAYLTDFDTIYNDAANSNGQDAWEPDSAFSYNMASKVTTAATMTQLFHRPAGTVTDEFGGTTYSPYYPNTLGVNSYTDYEQEGSSDADSKPPFPLSGETDVAGGKMEYNNAPQTVPSQQYDIYRLLCRGPVPISVLDAYLPTVTAQKQDILTGNPARNVLTANRCVIWSSPFAGDEFADNGTIADPNTQADLTAFVQGGGRLMVEGIDVGFALTNNGAVNNAFYTNILSAKFGVDGVTPAGDNLMLTGSSKATDYISEDAFVNNADGADDGNYPEFGGPIGHTNFKFASDGGTGDNAVDVIPNWTYLPPSAGRIGLALDERNVIGSTDSRTDASLEDGPIQLQGITPLGFIDSFSNTLAAPAAVGPVAAGSEATELTGTGSTVNDQLAYTVFAPPTGVNFGGATVIYSSFGIESISQEVVPLEEQAGTNSEPALNYEVYSVEAQRTDIMHNIICYLRTGSINGTVTNTAAGGQANAEVIAYPVSTATYNNSSNAISYTGTTNASGNFTIVGVPAGRYSVFAYASGVSFQHTNGSTVDVHGGDVGTINLQVSPSAPGSLNVTVVSAVDGSLIPGATVNVAESLTGSPSYPGTTNSSGVAAFSSVATGSYTVTVSKAGFSNGTATVTVTTGTQSNVTVTLTVGPATLTGTVTSAATGAVIDGATVTATNNSVAADVYTTVTGVNGTYTLSNIVPGTYTVTCSAANYNTATSTGQVLGSNATVTLNFQLTAEQFSTVSGAVLNANGQPLSGVSVTLNGTATSFTQTATTSSTTFADPTTPSQTDNAQFTDVPYGTYTVTAASGLGNVTTSSFTVSSANTTFPSITLPAVHTFTYQSGVSNVLQMISAPYEYSGSSSSLADLFGYANPKITTWLPLSNAYATPGTSPADTLHLGIGYWVRFPATESLLVAGTPVSGSTFSIPLYTGWNMIGEPFVIPTGSSTNGVSVSTLTVTASGSKTYSFAQATSAQVQLLGPTLYTFLPGDTAYEAISGSGTLNQYQGYWIHAFSDVTLNFTRP